MAKRKKLSKAAKKPRPRTRGAPSATIWLYGIHAVLAALGNPDRHCRRLLITANTLSALPDSGSLPLAPETVERDALEDLLPRDAVHQGIALEVSSLDPPTLEEAASPVNDEEKAVVIVLDQAADPRNVGAVLRSAAAFGARAVVVSEHGSPEAGGALAKAAAGALETVPLIREVNLSRALGRLKDLGFWCIGLDGQGGGGISEVDLRGRVALVLGGEGRGLRRLTREHCDIVARIPIADAMESLNLSNAAAIALYEWSRQNLQ